MSYWKEVSWIEAANAFSTKEYYVERNEDDGRGWCWATQFNPYESRYRIREKPSTNVTVTIPSPVDIFSVFLSGNFVQLKFVSDKEAKIANDIICQAIKAGS